jgi:thiamine biosynthesis lipoprotein
MHVIVGCARPFTLVALLATAAACMPTSSAPRSIAGTAQGTTYSLQWLGGADEASMEKATQAELERIDALLSNYRSDSVLERFNAARSVAAVELPTELVGLLDLARTVHAASEGCFDPTVRPLVRAWGFDTDSPAVPAADALEAARAQVGFDRLQIVDAAHVRKRSPEIEVDMASIGQGYTAGRLAALLENGGSTAYLAEIGGEIVTRGAKADGTAWRIGIENPTDETTPGPTLRLRSGEPTAVITSGTYRHFFDADGHRLGHVLDPRTGRPVEHSVLSVTVVGRDPAAAAAWATALLCLGPADGPRVAERERVAALLWIADAAGSATPQPTPAFVADWNALLAGP